MIDTLAFLLVIALLLGVGLFRSRQVTTEEGYLFAKREVSTLELTATLVMTELNTTTLLSFAGLGYLAGKRALYLPFIFLIGLLFYSFTVAKKWQEMGATSVVDLFRKKYGERLAKWASITLILSMALFTATYVKSLSLIFPFRYSSIIFVLLTLAMTLRGGLVAIIKTDLITFFLFCLFLPLLLFFAKTGMPLPSDPVILPSKFITSLILLTMFTYILAPWYGQKIFSARSKKTAFISVILAALLIFIFYTLTILAAAYLKTPLSSHETALPHLVRTLPLGMRGFAFALLFAAAATTLAGVWSAMSSMVISDLLPKGNPTHTRAFICTLIFALISLILSHTLVDQVFQKLILANIPVLSLSFALLAGFYWKGVTAIGAYVSIAVGLLWGTGCYLYLGEEGLYTWTWAVYGIPLIFGSGILTSLFTKSIPVGSVLPQMRFEKS